MDVRESIGEFTKESPGAVGVGPQVLVIDYAAKGGAGAELHLNDDVLDRQQNAINSVIRYLVGKYEPRLNCKSKIIRMNKKLHW